MLARREAPPYPDLWHTVENHFVADAQVSNWAHGRLNTAMQQSGQLSWVYRLSGQVDARSNSRLIVTMNGQSAAAFDSNILSIKSAA